MNDNHEVESFRHSALVEAHIFPQAPLDPISRDSTRHATSDGETHPSPPTAPPTAEEAQALTGDPVAASEDRLKLARGANAIRSRKALSHRQPQERTPRPIQTDSRFLPLRRRRPTTRRPPFVFIRRRNPWARFRLIRLG